MTLCLCVNSSLAGRYGACVEGCQLPCRRSGLLTRNDVLFMTAVFL